MFTDPKELYEYLLASPSKVGEFVKENSESQILDYKSWSALKQPAAGQEVERLSHVVCSLANTDGGVILFGVCDSPRGLEKHKFSEKEPENLQNVLSQQVNPPVWFAKHQRVSAKRGCEILLLLIPASRYIHQVKEDMCIYVRRGSASRRAFIQEIDNLYANRPQLVQLTKESIASISMKSASLLSPPAAAQGIASGKRKRRKLDRKVKDAEAYKNRGNTKYHKGDLDGAIADFTKAIELNSKYAAAYYNRGIAKGDKGDYDGAIADYNEAIRLNPKFALAYNNRGIAKGKKGDFDGAIPDFTEAIKLDPEVAVAYYNRGLAKAKKGDFDGAIADYNSAIRLNPKYAEAYWNRGNARDEKGDIKGAIADYNKAIEINPNDAEAYYNRGLVYDKKGDFNGAIADYSKAIEINPNHALAYNNRGIIHAKKGDIDGAIADYNSAIRLNPNDAKAYSNRGIAKGRKGDYDGAIVDYTEAIELNPKLAAAYNNRGIAERDKGDLEGAIADFDKAIELAKTEADKQRFRENRRIVAVQLRKNLLEKELGIFTDAVVEKLQPEQIIVYGSYARGDITERSDLDIIVILKSDKEFWDRQMLAAPFRSDKVGMDVSVYTPEEWEDKKVHNIFITQEVLPSMKVIYPKGEQDGGKTE